MTNPLIVELDSGTIRGRLVPAGDVRLFKGIPFADTTAGRNRWRPPQPVKPWTGTREMLEPGPVCPQPKAVIWPIRNPQDEDCLSLNVWAPIGGTTSIASFVPPTGPGAPVMLWIHGGGFSTGAGSTIFFDGEELARLGAVVITINYRLGPFGFLAHSALSAESPEGVSGNAGLLDQVAALGWARRHAAAFGGNPDCVTVFGESAGAASIARLLVSPKAAGLFHRAILQSGHARGRNRWLRRDTPGFKAAETVGAEIAARLGDMADDPADLRRSLRGKPTADILSAADPAQGLYGGGIKFAPVVDGVILPDDPERLFGLGHFHPVPILIGTNADEGSIFTEATRIGTREAFAAMLRRRFGPLADAAARLYPAKADEAIPGALVRLITDASFVAPVRSLARHLSSHAPGTTWMYHFTRVSPAGRKSGRGAFHAADVSYVFNRVGNPLAYDEVDRELAREMSATWCRFARTGQADWAPFNAANEPYREFGDTIRDGHHLRREAADLMDQAMAARLPDGDGQ
ncbi:MAG: carboxylesterase family protein [Candidatus Eisenbacteria bacterium]|nr:carboxylesterase family protein [Candidatus Eisenbacteria bacterium]